MLILIRIRIAFVVVIHQCIAAAGVDAAWPGSCAVGSVKSFRHAFFRARNLAALAEHARAVGVFKLYDVVVENFAVFFAYAHLAPAAAIRANRVGLFHPVGNVNVVDVLLHDVIAA